MVHLVSLAFRKASLNHILVDPMAGKYIFTQNMVDCISLNNPGYVFLDGSSSSSLFSHMMSSVDEKEESRGAYSLFSNFVFLTRVLGLVWDVGFS